jgi:hypothetical protein
MIYYTKKLTANDLGIRNGVPKLNPYILVSSQTRGSIFPDPPREPKNATFTFELNFRLPIVGENQKILFKAFNNNGTLYLAFNKKAHEIGILPDDIIIIEKLKEENQYKLENFKPSMHEYNKILLNLNGKKSLVSNYNPSF